MSHLHVPDGVLPIWLWLTGLIIAGAMISLSLFMTRRMDLKKKVPLLGMMSAMMLVGMSLEIVPIAYHVNLSVITGVILGPWLAILAAFMVNFILSLVGHGGVTTVGLNTIIIGSEGVLGWLMFNALRKVAKPRRFRPDNHLYNPFYFHLFNAFHSIHRQRSFELLRAWQRSAISWRRLPPQNSWSFSVLGRDLTSACSL